ncbi:uncharacterized protein LOC108142796 isoform X3 [Drosophila elegans]|uniref:uncharacterized protein LOC108142796 isoform X3 n=1 Tax=Drosophila elegans TaxID=30023 RepID=UPI001BC82E58|nr:uncharacterized protein LOC108142796 isoform X3 [Drosophila elegans]
MVSISISTEPWQEQQKQGCCTRQSSRKNFLVNNTQGKSELQGRYQETIQNPHTLEQKSKASLSRTHTRTTTTTTTITNTTTERAASESRRIRILSGTDPTIKRIQKHGRQHAERLSQNEELCQSQVHVQNQRPKHRAGSSGTTHSGCCPRKDRRG